jgi:hypothetical protein
VDENFVECAELTGKTIQSLRIYRDSGDGNELQIDLTDGTSFNCCFSTKTNIEASMLRAGAGEPETLRKYDLD